MANYETQFFINVIKYVSNISQKAHNGMNLDEQMISRLTNFSVILSYTISAHGC